jgi:nesprin-1
VRRYFYFLHKVECVTLISDQPESISIDRFMRETGERWKNVSMELRCVQSMLEEVVAYWRRWNTLADEFESWLDRAYGLLDLPEEDKMEYFQVTCQ